MRSDQDQDIPDLTEWLISEDEDTVEEIDLDDLSDAILLEDEVPIDIAI